MTSDDQLNTLLDDVRRADRLTRMELRDRVAAHGATAIDPMVEWLDDRELAAFAMRVLERVGRMQGQVRPVVLALSEGDEMAATPEIARDIEDALGRSRQPTVATGRPAPPSHGGSAVGWSTR